MKEINNSEKENFNIELPYPNRGLDRFERIEAIDYVSGFLPVSKPEQVEALSLQNFPEKVGGAAKHLAEVVLRQNLKKLMIHCEPPKANS